MLLYAETHYPRIWPSRIALRQPEIVADVPWWAEPERPVPVLILVKDAHWFPVHFDGLRIAVQNRQGTVRNLKLTVQQHVEEPYWFRVVLLPVLAAGDYLVDVRIRYTCAGRRHEVRADNHRLTSHAPFNLRVGHEPWPRPEGWASGDAHVHTWFTQDQAEFGPPVSVVSTVAEAMGMGFAALTDHSYDLDDAEGDYLVNDPGLPRWQAFQREARGLSSDRVCLIPGEEISCGNSEARNVHLLALNTSEYIPGRGDSAEEIAPLPPDLPIPEVIRRVREQGGLAVAAHPGVRPVQAEQILFRRGAWEWPDVSAESLGGLQIWNGDRDRVFDRGLMLWKKLLLEGRQIPALAGNDSHGSFGRFRQVRIPWLAMTDDRRHLFGRARTVVEAPSLDRATVMKSLAEGRSYLSDGPSSPYVCGERVRLPHHRKPRT